MNPVLFEGSSHRPQEYPIGIIIPTYNRADSLLECLCHLEAQTFKDFEVIVVDDGSTDETPKLLSEFARRSPLRLRCFRKENAGPGVARNFAVARLRAAIGLTIGDDILASPGLVESHLALHRTQPGLGVVGLGLTLWDEAGQSVTKFMRWLDESGVQFSYHDLLQGEKPSWKHFYTSNLSFKRDLFVMYPFDESFSKGLWVMEDIELGYRITQLHGLQLVFLREALASHLHPTTVRKTCKRCFHAGASAKHFHDIWPEQRPLRGSVRFPILRGIFFANPWLRNILISCAEGVTKVWCPNPLVKATLKAFSSMGYSQSDMVAKGTS